MDLFAAYGKPYYGIDHVDSEKVMKKFVSGFREIVNVDGMSGKCIRQIFVCKPEANRNDLLALLDINKVSLPDAEQIRLDWFIGIVREMDGGQLKK